MVRMDQRVLLAISKRLDGHDISTKHNESPPSLVEAGYWSGDMTRHWGGTTSHSGFRCNCQCPYTSPTITPR